MYKRILVAVDGSEIGNAALESAMQLAKAENSEIFVIHVLEYPTTYMPDVDYPIYDRLLQTGEQITKQADERMKQMGITGRSGVADNFLTGRTTAEQIQHMADAYHADLVILGTHGRRGFRRLILGSVAEAFVRMSTRPVLLIPQKVASTLHEPE